MPRSAPASLSSRRLTHDASGATRPADRTWAPPRGFRHFEGSAPIGYGEADWRAAASAVLRWGVKTRSGFTVEPAGPVTEGDRYWVAARWGLLSIHEPVEVVAVVEEPDRCGFAYGTLEGHPVSGEEAFVVHHDDGTVWLTLRSLTRAPRGTWRPAYPLALVAQRVYRRRYLRALLPTAR